MPPSDQSIDDLIAAILDGTPIDWSAAESGAGAERPLVRQLRLLASVADRFRGSRPTTSTPCEVPSADAVDDGLGGVVVVRKDRVELGWD